LAAIEKKQIESNKLEVINWLSAPDASLDQEACVSKREDIPETGQWILENPKVKDWLDPANSSVPVFWVNGIPGAGELIFSSRACI